ncbi:glycoside hydrolase family 88/105 protein [Pedobacter alpinus]|uniref:Glycoside hydrolase family 105 protein n=1 Tax=Pedobacter alpinus TaxID=1590643 RepID=A0ABW5TV48_9SPHI
MFNNNRTTNLLLASVLLFAFTANAQNKNKEAGKLAEDMAKTIMVKWPDSLTHEKGKPAKWSYDLGVFFKGMEGIYKRNHDEKYIKYMQHIMDLFVQPNGEIDRYSLESYNIDYVKNGSVLLFLYKQTKEEKYKQAASYLREQLKTHPRTKEGGFWHKKVYPHQMWLDGIYMGQPFYAEWSAIFNEPENFNDIANQFILLNKHAKDPKTGLLYHGWDESKEQLWANKETGTSLNFWGRAMGWYGIALVDVLEFFPIEHPKRKVLEEILQEFANAIKKVQGNNGLWYQVLDKQNEKGNYPEASASNMFVYTLAKGVRLGVLPKNYISVAKTGFSGVKKTFLEKDSNGLLHLNGTVQVSGLGGKPYRSGSYDYYLSEPVIQDDPKGMGAFIMAANEMAMIRK